MIEGLTIEELYNEQMKATFTLVTGWIDNAQENHDFDLDTDSNYREMRQLTQWALEDGLIPPELTLADARILMTLCAGYVRGVKDGQSGRAAVDE